MKPIMESYISVPPAAFSDDSPRPQKTEGQAFPEKSSADSDHMQLVWASSVENLLRKPELNSDDNISWSAHFAASQDSCHRPPAISGLMPLFRENAHSLAMVKHGMDAIALATDPSRTSPNIDRGSTTVCTSQEDTVDLARNLWER